MQERMEIDSESPWSHVIEVIAAVGVNAAQVEGAIDYLTVGPQTILMIIAPVGVANVKGVSGAAIASEASLDLDHDLIDLIEMRSGGVERLMSAVTRGDILWLSHVTRMMRIPLNVTRMMRIPLNVTRMMRIPLNVTRMMRIPLNTKGAVSSR